MEYKAYFKEEKKVYTNDISEMQRYKCNGYDLDIRTHTLTLPAVLKIFEIDPNNRGHIKEVNPTKFICEFYNKEIIAISDLELLIKDLKKGKVKFEDVLNFCR